MSRRGSALERTEHRRTSVLEADQGLLAMGHKQELKRNFSMISMLGLAFAILNSWTALSASLSLALPSGGSTSVIWGLVTAGICNLCLAASLAEFLSAYPTAGGQYHFVAMIAWKRSVPLLSWITGWINVAGWIALVASGGLLGSQLIVGVIALFHEDYVVAPWHQFLIYIFYNIIAFLINAFGTRLLPHITQAAFFWSITGFVVISITLLACSHGNYNSGAFVFGDFLNETGWPDGVAWLLGLLQGGLGLTGFDAVAHMIEEIPDPTKQGPKIMIYCILVGLFTGFIFLTVLLLVAGPVEDVVSSTAGPVLQIFYDATNSAAGSVCLLMFPLICLLFATITIMTTSSRMTYAFARDGGLPFSKFFAKVHPKLEMPLNALYLTTGLTIIFGCIFLGSSSAFNAIIAASVVALGVSYAIPPAVHCLRGRNRLPETRWFKLNPIVGWIVNIIGIAYAILTTVLFLFPPELPVTGMNMNYCIVVFFVVLVIAMLTWFIEGKGMYSGPKIDAAALQAGEVVGMAAETEGYYGPEKTASAEDEKMKHL